MKPTSKFRWLWQDEIAIEDAPGQFLVGRVKTLQQWWSWKGCIRNDIHVDRDEGEWRDIPVETEE